MSSLAQITAYLESEECDLCSKEVELVTATFRTAFPPDSQVCFACLKKLILVDHKHSVRRNGKATKANEATKENQS